MSVSFESILARWNECSSHAAQRKLISECLPGGDWLRACQTAFETGDIQSVEAWLACLESQNGGANQAMKAFVERATDYVDIGRFYKAQMRAYLYATKAAHSTPEDRKRLLNAAPAAQFPPAFYIDLSHCITAKSAIPAEGKPLHIDILLISNNEQGLTATLCLEKMPSRLGSFYPHPAHGFLYRGEDFVQAQQSALEYMRRCAEYDHADVRWSIKGIPETLLKTHLEMDGGSLGAAFAVAFRLLFRREARADAGAKGKTRGCPGIYDFTDYAVCAAVDASGQILGVNDLDKKLKGAEVSGKRYAAIFVHDIPHQVAAEHPGLPINARVDVDSVVKAILQDRHAAYSRQKRRRRLSFGFAVATVAAFALIPCFFYTRSLHVYRLEKRADGRIIVSRGMNLPLLHHGDYDTGLLDNQFHQDLLAGLIHKGECQAAVPMRDAYRALGEALSDPRGRAELYIYSNQQGKARASLKQTMAEDPVLNSRMMAALRLANLDPAERPYAINALKGWFQEGQDKKRDEYPHIAGILSNLSGSGNPETIAAMQRLLANEKMRSNHRQLLYAFHVVREAKPQELSHLLQILPLKKMAQSDTDEEAASRAAYELFWMDHNNYAFVRDTVIRRMTLHDIYPFYYAYQALAMIGFYYPEKLLESTAVFERIKIELKVGADENPNSQLISLALVESLKQWMDAENIAALHRISRQISGYSLNEHKWIEIFSFLGSIKLAQLARQQSGPPGVPDSVQRKFNFLWSEMQSPIADEFAVYRLACARAMFLAAQPSERKGMLACLVTKWHTEEQEHLRIALGTARDDFIYTPEQFYHYAW